MFVHGYFIDSSCMLLSVRVLCCKLCLHLHVRGTLSMIRRLYLFVFMVDHLGPSWACAICYVRSPVGTVECK
jgi:hypothetical protein